MSSIGMSLICAACILAGTFVGMFLRHRLPGNHLNNDSKDTIKMASGVIATLAALVLGLLVASAKNSFDLMNSETTQAGAKILLLDGILRQYGPEAQPVRDQLRRSVEVATERVWPTVKTRPADITALENANGMEKVQESLRSLTAKDDYQHLLLSQAYQMSNDLLQLRWLLIEQAQGSLPAAFFIVLLFWLTMLYVSIGLFAPPNLTVITALLICSLSFSAAIFLILEMNRPFGGFIQLSSGPMIKALDHLHR